MKYEQCKVCPMMLTIRNESNKLRRICTSNGKTRIEKVKPIKCKMETSNKGMTLNEYQTRAMTTCADTSRNIAYMSYAICEEAGEIAGKFSKAIRKGVITILDNHLGELVGKEEEFKELTEGIKKECGDLLWQLQGLCTVMGWTLEEVAQANLDKLADRQKRNKIIGEGDNR